MNTIHFILFSLLTQVFTQEVEYYPSRQFINSIEHNNYKDKKNIKHLNSNANMRFYNNNLTRIHNHAKSNITLKKRAVDPIFHGHPKTKEDLWNERFLNKTTAFDQTPSLIKLINNITLQYLNDCISLILYDSHVEYKEGYLLQNLFRDFPVSYFHGRINNNDYVDEPRLLMSLHNCRHYIVFLADINRCAKVIGLQATSKVVVIARSSQWAVQEFLGSSLSRKFVNLLVIGQTFKDDDDTLEAPYILYTHKLYTDGLGASKPVVLNSWNNGKYSRNVNLFPQKMTSGYAGHRFIVAAAHQPPFVFKRIISDADGGNPRVVWDGIEMRILNLLAQRNNFSIEIREPKDLNLGPGDAVANELAMGRADVGLSGIYLTKERIEQMDMSFSHSQDCAAFITLMSTALPRYRAILGPFHWHVWVALTFTYLIAIFPLAFSDKHSLRHLLKNSGEVENMFWYVFGTFTNCFTFVGKNSWSKTTKVTTRLLIGWYWIFTIIITSCYTGSIIAFVTLPIFPSTVDSIDQLLNGFFRIGTLDRGGWERWFVNSSDNKANKLFKKIEFLPNVAAGIRNTTKAFFWPYAFLGSKAELEYIVQANFTDLKSKKGALHISNECFAPFGVSMAFPNQSLYTSKINGDLRRMHQSGLLDKIVDEVRWELQRGSSGQLLSVVKSSLRIVSVEDKGLTLEDTQGMFLLLAAGFLMAGAALMSEWMGGWSRKCCPKRRMPSSTLSRSILPPSPNTNLDSNIELVSNGIDSRLDFARPTSSGESDTTLNGEIIYLSEDNVRDSRNSGAFSMRRSSSIEVEREIEEIFTNDCRRRRRHMSVSVSKDVTSSSDSAFGDHVT